MIGVFGGSGFYRLFGDAASEVEVETPYGPPAAPLSIGTIGGVEAAFLPRHGVDHQFPPHRVPYRANLWAMKEVGVDRVIGPTASGSLRLDIEPGQLVVPDQLVDRTSGRAATFHDGPEAVHVAFADPYCPELRPEAVGAIEAVGATGRDGGTMVVIEGPRFSTKAESRWFIGQGWDVINMTQYPEAILARELEMCFVNISVVTDYDAGVEGAKETVSHAAVISLFQKTLGTLRDVLGELIPRAAATPRACPCATALADATG